MRAPSDTLRRYVATTIEGWPTDLPDERYEDYLDDLLVRIEREMDDAMVAAPPEVMSVEQAEDQLSVVVAWAGLISYAVARVYAPASPWPLHHVAWWAQTVVKRLVGMARKLWPVLQPAAERSQPSAFRSPFPSLGASGSGSHSELVDIELS